MTIQCEEIYSGFNKFYNTKAKLEDGSKIEREVVKTGDAAGILVVDHYHQTLLLVRQYRVGFELNNLEVEPSDLYEIPCGIIDPGETPEETAIRELFEETGVQLQTPTALRKIGCFHSSPGILTEIQHIFVANYGYDEKLMKAEEGISIEWVTWNHARHLVECGFTDLKTAYAIQNILSISCP